MRKVEASYLNSIIFRPGIQDTIWRNENRLVIRKSARESNAHFLVDQDSIYWIVLTDEDKNWKFRDDSIVIYHRQGRPHWSRVETNYKNFWSNFNPNYNRSIFPMKKPDGVELLPKKPGIYLLTDSLDFVKVTNTKKSGIYYFSEFYSGIDEVISVDELLNREYR